MLCYKLDKNIQGEKILQDIQKLVTNFRKHNTDAVPILCVTIRTITHDDTSLIPKIEYRPLD